MVSIYQLKPRFQALLRPGVRVLARCGVTANAVTLLAMSLSVALGIALMVQAQHPLVFILLPLWMLIRMGLNAVDGMLAREFGQQSALGAYLNELCDVVSDAALYLPFAAIAPFDWPSVCAVIFLSALSEMTGALGPLIGAPRCYDGPMGKSDRAFVFGLLGLWVAVMSSLPAWLFWSMPAVCLAILVNVVNRVRSGIRQARPTIPFQ